MTSQLGTRKSLTFFSRVPGSFPPSASAWSVAVYLERLLPQGSLGAGAEEVHAEPVQGHAAPVRGKKYLLC